MELSTSGPKTKQRLMGAGLKLRCCAIGMLFLVKGWGEAAQHCPAHFL